MHKQLYIVIRIYGIELVYIIFWFINDEGTDNNLCAWMYVNACVLVRYWD